MREIFDFKTDKKGKILPSIKITSNNDLLF